MTHKLIQQLNPYLELILLVTQLGQQGPVGFPSTGELPKLLKKIESYDEIERLVGFRNSEGRQDILYPYKGDLSKLSEKNLKTVLSRIKSRQSTPISP